MTRHRSSAMRLISQDAMLLLHFQSARVRGQYQDLFSDQDGATPGANKRRQRQRYRSRNCADRSRYERPRNEMAALYASEDSRSLFESLVYRRLKARRAKDRANGSHTTESQEPAVQLGYVQAGAESCAWPIPQQWLRTAFQECQRAEDSVVRQTPISSQASD